MGRIILALLLLCSVAHAQPGYTKINARYIWIAGGFDSTLKVPGYCGAPAGIRSGLTADGQLAWDSCNARLYGYNNGSWAQIGGGGSGVDSVSNNAGGDSLIVITGGVRRAYKYPGGSQDLQSVTNIDNSTTNALIHDAGSGAYVKMTNDGGNPTLETYTPSDQTSGILQPQRLSFGNSVNYKDIIPGTITGNRTLRLPDSSGTIALLQNIPSGGVFVDSVSNNAGDDSLIVIKNGMRRAYAYPEGGSSQSQGLYYGTIYNDTVGNFTGDWVANGYTPTDSAGHLVFSGGASSFTNSYNINVNQGSGITSGFHSNVEKWTMSAKAKVITGGVLAIGLQSTSLNNVTKLISYINTSTGTLTNDGGTNAASTLTISPGDYIVLTVVRNGSSTYASVRNQTTNSATITTPVANLSMPGSTTPPPATGQFSIFNYSGKYYIDSVSVTSTVPRYADLLLIGTSKTQGYNGSWLTRYGTRLQDKYSVVVHGGGYETTADWLKFIAEVIALAPKTVIIENPCNDYRLSVNADSITNRMNRIESSLRAAGIAVYFIDEIYETGVSGNTYRTWLYANKSTDSIIYMYAPTSINGTLDVDNIHPTDFGHQVIANTIISAATAAGSPKIKGSITTSNSPGNFILNQTASVQPAGFNINGASTVANNFRVGSGTSSQIAFGVATEPNNNIYLYGSSGVNAMYSLQNNLSTFTPLHLGGSEINFQPNGATKLSLASSGAATFSNQVTMGSGSSGTVQLKVNTASNNSFQFFNGGSANGLYSANNGLSGGQPGELRASTWIIGNYTTGGANIDAMAIDAAGNIGIGTSSPSAKLHTTGTVRFANFGAGTATFDASGNISSVSDVRLKNVQGRYRAGLAAIMKIKPISFKWNDASGMETSHIYNGFSAQNIEYALGSNAIGVNSEGFKSIQDRNIMAAMINAIQEQQKTIDQLKKEIIKLKKR